MSKIEELASKEWSDLGFCNNEQSNAFKLGYLKGYHQAEKDLELSLEDIKLVHNITYEESRNVALNKGGEISEQEFYQEVLKRFKAAKEK